VELKRWLESNGLGKFAGLFEENDIDFALLPRLTERDIDTLGLSVVAKHRLVDAIESFNNDRSPPLDPEKTAQSGVAERSQLTVLFCDMVGFTEFASRLDPEELQTIIRVYEDTCAAAITRYEAYVFQRLGDGILAFFGYPRANSKPDGGNCALRSHSPDFGKARASERKRTSYSHQLITGSPKGSTQRI
jgi:class 3 adenylate cyclase